MVSTQKILFGTSFNNYAFYLFIRQKLFFMSVILQSRCKNFIYYAENLVNYNNWKLFVLLSEFVIINLVLTLE